MAELVGGFTLDAACDTDGRNSFCDRFCSARDSFLHTSLAGQQVWANFPFRHLEEFLLHYFEQKEADPSIMGCFVVPVWKSASWWPLVETLEVLAHYPSGSDLFTTPVGDGSRRSVGVTRWPVEVRYDPRDRIPDGSSGPSCPGPVEARTKPEASNAAAVDPAVLAAVAESRPHHTAAFWRLTVDGLVASRLPASSSPLLGALKSDRGPLPRLLHVKGKAANGTATLFLDSGAQLNLVSQEFAEKHHLKVEPALYRVGFPDGRDAALQGLVRNVPVKMGTYETVLDLHVFDLQGKFDVLLGKGWHDDANPQISWRHNLVQVFKDDKFHRFGTSATPPPVHQDGVQEADVAVLTAKAFRRASRKGDCFIGSLTQLMGKTGCRPAVNAVEANKANVFERVLKQYASVFEPLSPGMPPEGRVQHHIDLQPGARPKSKPPYRLSKFEEEECVRQLKVYLEMGHIQPSKSPYGAPVLFARKKNGKLRFCVDYRALNDQTIKDRFPLPRIDDLLDRLQGASVFSKLDLAQGYHQIQLAPEDVHKTAFTTQSGHFEFRVMPFGLCNAPATFQRLMNSTLSPYIGRFCMVYLDDIIVFSKDTDSHQKHLAMVLEKLAGAGLKTQISKCEFGMAKLEFLGHIVSADGIQMDPGKVKAMTDWPVPKNSTEVKGFLGLLNYYRRFIRNFARIALPLTELTRDEAKLSFTWTPQAQHAFETLKGKMVTGPVLQMPDLDKPFRVFTDACLFAAGGTLEQKHGQEWKPVAYFSKKFNPAQRNYDTRDREALGIVLALHEWRCYLQGSHFLVNNDHHTLQRLQSQAHLSSRNARWAEFLQEFDCTIQYVKGEDNAAADAFSRRPDLFAMGATAVGLADSFVEKIKSSYETDQFYLASKGGSKRSAMLIEKDGFVWHKFGKLYLPHALRQQVVLETHRSAYSGHFGVERVCAKLQEQFWWPRMTPTVKALLRSCHECQVVAPRNKGKLGLLKPIAVPQKCWEQVTLDLITGLPESDGYDACVVFVDRLSKMVHYAPCRKTINAPGMARLFIRDVVRLHGWPKVVISDRDPRFDADFWRSVLKGSGTQLRMSTAYHPETDGQTERANRTLLAMLRKFAIDSDTNWVDHLPWLEFAYNDSKHCGTGYTPFFLVQGSSPHVPLRNLVTLESPGVPDDSSLGQAFRQRLDNALHIARSNLVLSQARQSYYANRTRLPSPIKAGDEVLLDSAVFHFPELKGKLSEKWYGPLRVVSADEHTVLVRTPLDKDMHARVHVSGCKLYVRDPDEPRVHMPDSQLDKENWEIEAIVGHRFVGRRKEYRCRFKHAPHNTPAHDEWFSSANLSANRLRKEYQSLLSNGVTFVEGVRVVAGVGNKVTSCRPVRASRANRVA